MDSRIKDIRSREILSTSAFPSMETVVYLENGLTAKASVPYGTSAGRHEAVTLVDGDPGRYLGKGMLKAIINVNERIAPDIRGMDVLDQRTVDEKLISLDPTSRRENLGGNAILSVSLACARAAADLKGMEVYQHIRSAYGARDKDLVPPRPMMVVIEGGCHADNSTDLQEYLVAPIMNTTTRECVRAGIESYIHLGKILKKRGYNTNVGLEGAYAPTSIGSNEEPLTLIQKAIEEAGYSPGEEVGIALDPASSEFFKDDGLYHLDREGRKLSSNEMIDYYEDLTEKYPISSIEDGLGEDDWEAWSILNRRLGDKLMIMGDDLTVTNVDRLQKAIDLKAINAILIKPNQVGTLTETVQAIELAKEHDFKVVISHRGGGETTDTFIIDIAVATGANFVKVGPSRGERVVKYNRLMEIGDELGL